ncbi:MAG: Alanine racemase [Verrucomicrobiales bacterium]|nr:Alanine racemase [Verrucomicrobiales bacterium]
MLTSHLPLRPAWVEIDLDILRMNYDVINTDRAERAPQLKLISVLKDDAYGHGAVPVAREAAKAGVSFIALVTLQEAVTLREAGIETPILLMGEREPAELPYCVDFNLTTVVNDVETARLLGGFAIKAGKRAPLHIKINSGMSRFGLRWDQAAPVIQEISRTPGIVIEGILSHFAMSDELDKTFARKQLERFMHLLAELQKSGIDIPLRHICNSGGFLDLSEAHFDLVRVGLLQFGVFPSQVCRRIPGIAPVMSVKSRIAFIQPLEVGDCVGYGMRYTATSPRRIAVIPIGYGDGFPRVRNEGAVLIRGRRAPLVGGVSMDAITVDITDIPDACRWDEVVIMGRDGSDEITAHEVAQWKKSVSYDVLVSWRSRLPRVYKP